MNSLVRNKSIIFWVIAPVIIWSIANFMYISIYVGWDNFFSLLPDEIIVSFLGFVAPIALVVFLFLFFGVATKVEVLASAVRGQEAAVQDISAGIAAATDETLENRAAILAGMQGQEAAVKDISAGIAAATDETRESRAAILAGVEGHKELSREMSTTLARHDAGIADVSSGLARISGELGGIGEKLSLPARIDKIGLNAIDSDDFGQLNTLITLFTVALSDLSVVCTRILVRLMERDVGDKNQVKTYVGGLVEAYATGDKNVFFRALNARLGEDRKNTDRLRRWSSESPEFQRDISKILREAQEIGDMVGRCDKDHLLRIVFEESDLWELDRNLRRHFEANGTVKIP